MSAESGTLVLIKVGNGGSPETFTTIGGLRTSAMTLSNHTMDASNVQLGQWKQLQSNSGIMSMSISGGGMFTDSAAEEMVCGYAFAQSVNNYQLIFANGDMVSGPFMITAYSRSGDFQDEEIYTLTLESAGNITFTPA